MGNPKVICTKSKVAHLCGMDMKIYFHDHSPFERPHSLEGESPSLGIVEEEQEFVPNSNQVNRGASLLTFDPRTGFCEYKILGKAYVVVDAGDYPLSNRQVWGLQDLVSGVRDVYHCDPEHSHRGIQQLLRLCEDYRHQNYGPLIIYEPRYDDAWKEDSENLSILTVVPEDHYHHRQRGRPGEKHIHHPNQLRPQQQSQQVDHSCGDKYGPRARFRDDDVFHLLEPLEQPFFSPSSPQAPKKLGHAASKPRRIPRIFGACSALA